MFEQTNLSSGIYEEGELVIRVTGDVEFYFENIQSILEEGW